MSWFIFWLVVIIIIGIVAYAKKDTIRYFRKCPLCDSKEKLNPSDGKLVPLLYVEGYLCHDYEDPAFYGYAYHECCLKEVLSNPEKYYKHNPGLFERDSFRDCVNIGELLEKKEHQYYKDMEIRKKQIVEAKDMCKRIGVCSDDRDKDPT